MFDEQVTVSLQDLSPVHSTVTFFPDALTPELQLLRPLQPIKHVSLAQLASPRHEASPPQVTVVDPAWPVTVPLHESWAPQLRTQVAPPQDTLPAQDCLPLQVISQLAAAVQSTPAPQALLPHVTRQGCFSGQTTGLLQEFVSEQSKTQVPSM